MTRIAEVAQPSSAGHLCFPRLPPPLPRAISRLPIHRARRRVSTTGKWSERDRKTYIYFRFTRDKWCLWSIERLRGNLVPHDLAIFHQGWTRAARVVACIPRTFLCKTTALSDLTLMLNFYSGACAFAFKDRRGWVEKVRKKFLFPFYPRDNSGVYRCHGSLIRVAPVAVRPWLLRPCRWRNQRNVAARAGFRPANDLPRYSMDE